jgi:hypothetical protein
MASRATPQLRMRRDLRSAIRAWPLRVRPDLTLGGTPRGPTGFRIRMAPAGTGKRILTVLPIPTAGTLSDWAVATPVLIRVALVRPMLVSPMLVSPMLVRPVLVRMAPVRTAPGCTLARMAQPTRMGRLSRPRQ